METLKNKAIGVMDSGVGGLTVLKQLVEIAPNENYLYFEYPLQYGNTHCPRIQLKKDNFP